MRVNHKTFIEEGRRKLQIINKYQEIEKKKKYTKKNANTLMAIGVGAAATVLTGGVAGVAAAGILTVLNSGGNEKISRDVDEIRIQNEMIKNDYEKLKNSISNISDEFIEKEVVNLNVISPIFKPFVVISESKYREIATSERVEKTVNNDSQITQALMSRIDNLKNVDSEEERSKEVEVINKELQQPIRKIERLLEKTYESYKNRYKILNNEKEEVDETKLEQVNNDINSYTFAIIMHFKQSSIAGFLPIVSSPKIQFKGEFDEKVRELKYKTLMDEVNKINNSKKAIHEGIKKSGITILFAVGGQRLLDGPGESVMAYHFGSIFETLVGGISHAFRDVTSVDYWNWRIQQATTIFGEVETIFAPLFSVGIEGIFSFLSSFVITATPILIPVAALYIERRRQVKRTKTC